MSIKIFLVFIGILFAASAGMFVWATKLVSGFKQYGKGPLIHLSLTSIITGAALFFISYLNTNLFNAYIIFLLIFCGAGLVHIILMYKKFWAKSDNKSLISELVYSLSILGIICILFSSMNYFFHDKEFMYYPMLLSSLGFFLPTVIHKTFEKAISIPQKLYKKWYYPLHNPPADPDDEDLRDLIVIGFEMEKTMNENQRTYFRARAPQRMDLGILFYHFINDYNDRHSETPIQIIDEKQRPYAWVFQKKVKWNKANQTFDPETPIFANGIKENTVIICKRIIEKQNNTTNV